MLSFWMRLISLATSDGLDLFLFLGCLSLLQLSSIIIMLWFWYPCLSFFHTVFVSLLLFSWLFFFFNQKTAYEVRISDWSSDVCSSDLFPGGPQELIRAFSAAGDRRMLEALEGLDLGAMKVREKIAAGVRCRLEAVAAHREAVRSGLAFFALPQNAAAGLASLYRTVDAIWYAAGDRATDYNFYTKRALLAGVYPSTLLYWLNDRAEGFAAPWAFLDRRIGEVLKVAGQLGKIGRAPV